MRYFREVIIAGLVIFILWFVQCGGRKVVTIPGKAGEIKTQTEIQYLPSKPQTITIKGKDGKNTTITVENPVNKELLDKYQEAKDSIAKLKLYAVAIEEKEQIRTFEQDGVKIEVKSKTRGDLISQSVKYQLPPQEIKKDNFGFLTSGGINKTISTQNYNVQIGAGIRIKDISILVNANTNKQVGLTLIKEF